MLLYKKGNKFLLSNYRGITLLSSIYKAVMSIVTRRKTLLKERSGVFSSSQGGAKCARTPGQKIQIILNCFSQAKIDHQCLVLIAFDLVKRCHITSWLW